MRFRISPNLISYQSQCYTSNFHQMLDITTNSAPQNICNLLTSTQDIHQTFKEFKSKISIPFSFLSKYWKLENKPYYLAYARTVGSWSNSRAWFVIVVQNSEVKLMPNERSRLILKGSLVKPSGISPSANQR